MTNIIRLPVILLISFATVCLSANLKLVCYWGSWSANAKGPAQLTTRMIDPKECTHLMYSYAGVDPRTFRLRSLDPWNDLSKGDIGGGLGNFQNLVDLKNANPDLKVLLAVGGWAQGTAKFSAMASKDDRRKGFVNSAVALLKKYRFDGLSLDWQWPGFGPGSNKNEDKNNYLKLVKDFSTAFKGNSLLLAAVGPATNFLFSRGFDAQQLKTFISYLDFMTIAAYDYETNPNTLNIGSPLHPNVDETIAYYLKNGAPANKLVLGTALYGRAYNLQQSSRNAPGDPAAGYAKAGPYTQQSGILAYYEVCYKVYEEDWEGFKIVYNQTTQTPYAYNTREWISYENAFSLKNKVVYIKSKGLAGLGLWSLEHDDNNLECSENRLVQAASKEIRS